MGQYKFSLDNILNWRSSQEEDAKRSFLVYQQAQREQESILEGIVEARCRIKQEQTNLVDINTLRQQYIYKNHLDNEIVKQEETVKKYSNETEKMKEIFVGAQKERKILEKLKEKHFDSYLLEQKSEEQKELDEMGTLRFKNSVI
ncbi:MULTISPECIES: flagellar export protein FliJ [Vagococcus]|uniref:Flagellar FliJ protein n=1 Tax=Vagococcus fluvialis bH819 TaxID=1255619 RepID=A0A1X6WRL8_9ENTE|nr:MULTISPECIES: flagellar export protein FliJ [Vagococcus]SLM86882.1 Flagellar protein FliJ [Vagococcus fluvialis bH819]HCM88661.1 flagellar export protein FliJ [Vagococcus sp.]